MPAQVLVRWRAGGLMKAAAAAGAGARVVAGVEVVTGAGWMHTYSGVSAPDEG